MYDIIIIGAGVIGVAIARALALQKSNLRIAVVEKEEKVACHTSGRNSGVVHAGFNPKPGTLKARFCVEGNRRIKEFCLRKAVHFKAVGTLVVAGSKTDIKTLEELYQWGKTNGVPDLKLLEQEDLKKLEPNVKGCAALYAPSGAVVDSPRFVEALAQEAGAHGVSFLFGKRVRMIEEQSSGYIIYANDLKLKGQFLINAAGLYADHIAHMLGVGKGYVILPFRGEYYHICPRKANLVRSMVYPVPDLNYPFLGIHFTPTVQGGLKVGPNAVLALGREAYKNTQINLRETLAMLFDARTWKLLRPEFLKLVSRHLWTSLSKKAFLREAKTLVNGIEKQDLLKGPPAGNRAQLVDRDGRLIDDVIVESKGNSIHILNVISPGLTCSLPFADHVVSLLMFKIG